VLRRMHSRLGDITNVLEMMALNPMPHAMTGNLGIWSSSHNRGPQSGLYIWAHLDPCLAPE
jgi:hypothetical protein